MSNVVSKTCQQCGAPADSKATTCRFCGAEIAMQPEYQAPQAPQYASPQAPQYAPSQAPQYAPPQSPQYAPAYVPPANISAKNKTTAGVLAILFGGLGIHKFYLGRVGLGIVYILFCWTYIPALIGLIEGIIYLSANEETFYLKYVKK